MAYTIAAVLAGSATDPCCCGPVGCCPYPAVGYDVEYFYDDFPAAINVVYDSGSPPGPTLTKTLSVPELSLPGYTNSSDPPLDGEWALVTDGINWLFYVRTGGVWVLTETMNCLLTGPDTGIKSMDQFSNTYTITFIWSVDGLSHEVHVTRIPETSLCEWLCDEPDPDGIVVDIFYGVDFPFKFELYSNASDAIPMDDPQSSPDGTYPDSATFSSIVVSAP